MVKICYNEPKSHDYQRSDDKNLNHVFQKKSKFSIFKKCVSVFTSFYEVFKSSESGDCVFCIHVKFATIPKEWYLFYFQTITDTPIVWKSWSMTLSCKCCVTETDQRQPRSWTLRISWVSVLLWDSLDDTSPSPRAIIGSIQEQPGIVTCYNSSFMQMLCLNLLIFSQFLLQTSKTKDMK